MDECLHRLRFGGGERGPEEGWRPGQGDIPYQKIDEVHWEQQLIRVIGFTQKILNFFRL